MQNLVALNHVSMAYGKGATAVRAIEDVTLNIAKGEFIAVVGPSGCGKSSLMKLISGLHPPLAGQLTIEGRPVKGPLKSVGMAFQNSNLLPWRTCVDNVLLPLEIVQPHRGKIRSQRAVQRKSRATVEQRRADWLHGKISVGAIRRHAATRLDLPRADTRAGNSHAR